MKIRIHGIKDGIHDVREIVPVEEIEGMLPEFFGNVSFVGKMRKIGKRYTITGFAECNIRLICDLSLEEYTDTVSSEIKVSFIANTDMFLLQSGQSDDPDAERAVHEDDEFFDISNDVREQLAVSIPMKRIAPQYRNKTFADLHPEFSAEITENISTNDEEQIDERWKALKNIKLN
jgi:uncharacterized metal-binding protein YceD (DUF177 family)